MAQKVVLVPRPGAAAFDFHVFACADVLRFAALFVAAEESGDGDGKGVAEDLQRGQRGRSVAVLDL